MSISRRILFGASASWLSRALNVLFGLLLVPVLFRQLGSEDLGVWMLLGQTWSVMGVLDLGLGFTLTRRIALAKGKSGSDPHARLNAASQLEIADLIECGRRVYRWLALVTFLVAAAGGYFYLWQLHLASLQLPVAWAAWTILCLSQAFGLWAAVWTCVLQGMGYVGWDTIVVSGVNTLVLVLQIGALLLGGHLATLAIVAAAGALAQRWLILGIARRKSPQLFRTRGKWNPALARSMVPPALRAWVTSLGGVLVLNSDQFFIAQLCGPTEIPAYRAAYLILLNVNMLAVTLASTSAVFVSHLWEAGELHRVRRLVLRTLKVGLSIMTSAGVCVLVLGPRLFDFWLQPGHFVGYPVLVVFFVLLTLETQSYIVSTLSRATEDEAFAGTTVIAAVLKVGFSWGLGVKYGLVGIALGTLLAQLFTNHWFMLVRGLGRLRLRLGDHLRHVWLPVSTLCLMTGAPVWGVKSLLADWPSSTVVGAGVAAAALVFAAGLWMMVLDRAERARIFEALLFRPAAPTALN